MKQRAVAVLCLLALLCLLGGCSDPVGKSIVCEDLIITLPGDFIDLSEGSYAQNAELFYGRKTLIVMGLAEKKALLKKMTLEEYTAYVVSGNKLDCTPEAFGDGYVFRYEAPVGDTTYTYVTATFEGQTNFWIFQFYGPSANFRENEPEINVILEGIQPNPNGEK